MDLVSFTASLVKSIVTDEDMVTIKEFPTDEENEVLIEVIVSSEDVGKVIGKNGKVINAIKTLVQASSYIKENKNIKINVDSF